MARPAFLGQLFQPAGEAQGLFQAVAVIGRRLGHFDLRDGNIIVQPQPQPTAFGQRVHHAIEENGGRRVMRLHRSAYSRVHQGEACRPVNLVRVGFRLGIRQRPVEPEPNVRRNSVIAKKPRRT